MVPRRNGVPNRVRLGLVLLVSSLVAVAPAAGQAVARAQTATTVATTVAPAPVTTAVATTTTAPAPATTTPVVSTTSTTRGQTFAVIIDPTTTTVATGPGGGGPTTSTTKVAGPPPASLSNSAVSSILDSLSKTSPSSTVTLLTALQPLQNLGFTPDAAALMGMGRFPVGGVAYYRDDFGEPRTTPEPHSHQGTDIFAAFDTPVRSPATGVLRYANEPAAGGLVAYVTEADGTWYYAAHLRRFADGVSSGATVKVGQVIGFVGDTGNAAGGAPHTHFEVHPKGGAAVNPKPFLDAWLADALAAVPTLLAPFQQQDVTRPFTNVGLVRSFDQGMLAGPSRLLAPAEPATVGSAGSAGTNLDPGQHLADALIDPLTPAVLLTRDATRL